jgi:predicted metal-dependent TIM-barrel fold hydrolase
MSVLHPALSGYCQLPSWAQLCQQLEFLDLVSKCVVGHPECNASVQQALVVVSGHISPNLTVSSSSSSSSGSMESSSVPPSRPLVATAAKPSFKCDVSNLTGTCIKQVKNIFSKLLDTNAAEERFAKLIEKKEIPVEMMPKFRVQIPKDLNDVLDDQVVAQYEDFLKTIGEKHLTFSRYVNSYKKSLLEKQLLEARKLAVSKQSEYVTKCYLDTFIGEDFDDKKSAAAIDALIPLRLKNIESTLIELENKLKSSITDAISATTIAFNQKNAEKVEAAKAKAKKAEEEKAAMELIDSNEALGSVVAKMIEDKIPKLLKELQKLKNDVPSGSTTDKNKAPSDPKKAAKNKKRREKRKAAKLKKQVAQAAENNDNSNTNENSNDSQKNQKNQKNSAQNKGKQGNGQSNKGKANKNQKGRPGGRK